MILILANARIKGGLSGSDSIYINIWKHEENCRAEEMHEIDFKPFALCYAVKIVLACWRALWDSTKYEYVYSASDFWMDSLPAFIHKLKGNKWVAGFYLFAPKTNKIYYYTQKPIIWLINRFADVVCVTNESMFKFDKPMIAVHGGVDLSLAYSDDKVKKIYDAVFVGRLHYTKGISELMQIWDEVLKVKPDARLAVIGDGDTEACALLKWARKKKGVDLLGYMGEERFDVYRQSEMVLYTTPHKYSHFSMGPVEVMACGCPMVAFNIDVMKYFDLQGVARVSSIISFANTILWLMNMYDIRQAQGREAIEWAQGWDWSVRAPKILKEIREKLCVSW